MRKARSVYLKQASEVTRSKLQAQLSKPECRLTLLCSIEEVTNKRTKVQFKCECGAVVWKRPTDVIDGNQIECPACACKRRARNQPPEQFERLQKMAASMKGVLKVDPRLKRLRRRCQVAKDRCVNPKNKSFVNYGGRGITFEFASASEMAKWIVTNIGYPEDGQSLDRINNDKGYAPGNLRWASSKAQGNNKREYKRTEQGERIRRLQKLRPDFSYERIREFINEGLTDDDIINRKRTTSGRPRVRH